MRYRISHDTIHTKGREKKTGGSLISIYNRKETIFFVPSVANINQVMYSWLFYFWTDSNKIGKINQERKKIHKIHIQFVIVICAFCLSNSLIWRIIWSLSWLNSVASVVNDCSKNRQWMRRKEKKEYVSLYCLVKH
jgi:hypothetical protein